VFADDVAEESFAANSASAVGSSELAPVGDAEGSVPAAVGGRKGSSRSSRHRAEDDAEYASSSAAPLLPSTSPKTSYEAAEAAIHEHLAMDAQTAHDVSRRVSQSERFHQARLKDLVGDDDLLLKVYDRSVDDPNMDEEDREVKVMRAEERKARIRLDGTTGAGHDGQLSGVKISDSDRIALHSSQESLEESEIAAVSKDNAVTADMLTAEQKHLLWEDRKRTYSIVHRKMLLALESHHSEMDKLFLLMELHDIIIQKRLRMRCEVYEDILATAFTALTGPEHYTSNNRSTVTMLEELWVMYNYCVDSGTDPSPKLIQNMMRILSLCATTNPDVEAKAHRLMLDSDRFKLIPKTTALSTYFAVCARNNAMHIAVSRLVDAKSRLEVTPTATMVYTIMNGFRLNKRADDGIRFLTTVSNTPITKELFSEVIHTAKESSNPLSAFTFYRSMRQSSLRPDVRVMTSLIIAMEVAGDYTDAKFVLSEIMAHRVKLENDQLNRLLLALQHGGNEAEFCKLFASMSRTGKALYTERFDPNYVALAKKYAARMAENERKNNNIPTSSSSKSASRRSSSSDSKQTTRSNGGGGGRTSFRPSFDAAHVSRIKAPTSSEGNVTRSSANATTRRPANAGYGGRGDAEREVWRGSHGDAEERA